VGAGEGRLRGVSPWSGCSIGFEIDVEHSPNGGGDLKIMTAIPDDGLDTVVRFIETRGMLSASPAPAV